MSSIRRSTNERALARHHALLKRFPAAVDHAANNADDDDPLAAILGLGDDDTTTPVAHTISKPAVTVLPPIGTSAVTKPVVPTTGPAVVSESSASSTVPKVTSTPNTPTPTSASSAASVVKTPITSASPVTPTSTPTPSPTAVATGDRGVQPTVSTTAAAESSASGSPSSKSSQGLSPGATGAIVTVIVLLALAVAAFFVRRHYQRRRAMKRNTWGAGLVPSLENKRLSVAYESQAPTNRAMSLQDGVSAYGRLANVPATTQMSQAFGAPYQPSTPSTVLSPTSNAYAAQGPPGLTHPASLYNPTVTPPPTSSFGAAAASAPSLRSMTPTTTMHAAPAAESALVARTFIPSLPDELHIATGEQIRILSAYDDGWALCANGRGDQGVVPLECLDRRATPSAEMQLQPQSAIGSEPNRTSRRISSLAPIAPGTY